MNCNLSGYWDGRPFLVFILTMLACASGVRAESEEDARERCRKDPDLVCVIGNKEGGGGGGRPTNPPRQPDHPLEPPRGGGGYPSNPHEQERAQRLEEEKEKCQSNYAEQFSDKQAVAHMAIANCWNRDLGDAGVIREFIRDLLGHQSSQGCADERNAKWGRIQAELKSDRTACMQRAVRLWGR
jgi:hypothetical protein